MTSVLMIVSAADHWTLSDGTQHPTGFWVEELVVPHDLFADAGWDITIATPGGRAPTVDEKSLSVVGGFPRKIAALKKRLTQLSGVLKNPKVLSEVDPDQFDVVFYPGGHGPMEDLAHDEDSGRILTRRLEQGRPLALLCHAPAAIAATADPDGRSPFAGRKMTGLSNTEEAIGGLAKKAPWLLEDKLKELGVQYTKAVLPYRPYIVVDGALFTGENPQSSEMLAKAVIDAVG